MAINKVRVNSLYAFRPVPLDRFESRLAHVPVDTIVRVINPWGCPPANVAGHCYIEFTDHEFIGLVHCNSLVHVIKRGKRYFIDPAQDGIEEPLGQMTGGNQ